MSVNPIAAGLTEAHRSAQAKRGAFMAYAIAALWARTVRQDNFAETTERFLQLALALIRRERPKSVALTRAYYPQFRALEVPDAPRFELPDAPPLSLPAVETSLRVTGPIAFAKKMARLEELKIGDRLAPEPFEDEDGNLVEATKIITPEFERAWRDEAFESAGRTAAASAVRHTLDGGRDLMREAAQEDRLAIGWARVTRDDPCYFCAMLASRGPLYGEKVFTDSDAKFTGSGIAKVHDACQCTMEPSYSRKSDWPGRGRDFEALWIQATQLSDGGPKEDRRAFRALVEGREYRSRRKSR